MNRGQLITFVITVRDLPGLYKYGNSMNKIFEYMAAGRPIVIALNAVNNPVVEADAGFTVSPEDSDALADGIEHLLNLTHEERVAMGARARYHVEKNYSFEILAERFANILDKVYQV